MSAAQTRPPLEPFCSAAVTEIPPVGMNGATLRCEVQGHPDVGGVYYWTPAQARAIYLALAQAHGTWRDQPPLAGMPLAWQKGTE